MGWLYLPRWMQSSQECLYKIVPWCYENIFSFSFLPKLSEPPQVHYFLEIFESFKTHLNFEKYFLFVFRKRKYDAFCDDQGLEPHPVPAVCTTRFRNNVKLSVWAEKDDRCLYTYCTKLKDNIKSGIHKDITDTEGVILEEYLSNYICFRLSNMFTIDVSKPALDLINHFESSEPKIYERWDSLRDFFHDLLQKFMKNAANFKETSMRNLLDLDFSDRSRQLGNKDIFLGGQVETFLRQLGLTRESMEISSWLDGVREFYIEALEKTAKYFKPSLMSKTLRYMDIANPAAFVEYDLDDLKKRYRYVAERFPNIIPENQIPTLLDQVAYITTKDKITEAAPKMNAEEFFHKISTFQEGRFSLVGRLVKALLTIHNSSSQAERDFSIQVCAYLKTYT